MYEKKFLVKSFLRVPLLSFNQIIQGASNRDLTLYQKPENIALFNPHKDSRGVVNEHHLTHVETETENY